MSKLIMFTVSLCVSLFV